MADDTKKVRMSKHYTPGTGPRRGKTLFAAEVYELDQVTAKEVVGADAGSYSQKQATVSQPANAAEAQNETK